MFNNSYIRFKINQLYFDKKIKKEPKLKIKICTWCKCSYINDKNGYFCSKKCNKLYQKEKNQIFKHNNRCEKHKFSKLTFRNKCWKCYKKSFYKNKKPKIYSKIALIFNGFDLYPTFRTSKDSWNGDKIAFEQNLKNKQVKWFIYIKFYINKRGKAVPLVCGKSGSILVNSSGSDLNFSINIKDGPARRFIHDNNYEWCYDFIFIKKCKSESHAYKLESKFIDKFNLFKS